MNEEVRAVAELLAQLAEGADTEEEDFTVEDVTCIVEEPAGAMKFYALLDNGHHLSVTVQRES